MSWFYELRKIPSVKNGVIVCQRLFGRWKVFVNGYDQTSPYMQQMWRHALRKVPKTIHVKQILVLGLGAGGVIRDLHRRFHGCQVTVVEWDPEMVKLSEKLHLFSTDQRPRGLYGDVEEVLPAIRESFDLILFDLYNGFRPALYGLQDAFPKQIARLLKPQGVFLLNAFSTQALLSVADQELSRHKTWQFRYNTVALYRQFGQGHVGDALPNGCQNFRSTAAYWNRERTVNKIAEMVGDERCPGLRWHYGPVWFESYTTDQEPRLEPHQASRIVIWQPVTRLDVPKGWRRSWLQMNARCTGFAMLEEGKTEEYWKGWSSHAQRHRRRWLRDEHYTTEEVAFDLFLAAYKTVPKLPMIKDAFIELLSRKQKAHGNLNHYFAVREKKTGEIVAGLATLDLPEARQSVHLLAFIQPCAESTSASTGLIDCWFQDAIKRGITFLDFDLFYVFGEPFSWRGFTRFKGQFGIWFVRYPNPLVRWVRGGVRE